MSAVLIAAAFPGGIWSGLAWIALAPLLWAVTQVRTATQAFLLSWVAGSLLMVLVTSWLTPAIEYVLRWSTAPASGLMLVVAAFDALPLAVCGMLIFLARRHAPSLPMVVVAPLALVCAELLLPSVFGRKLGFMLADWPAIAQVADVTGLSGLSFLLATVNACWVDLAAALHRRRLPMASLLGTAMVLAVVMSYAQQRLEQLDRLRAEAPQLRVGLVQGNIGYLDAADPARAPAHFARYAEASRALRRAGAAMIVWPEGAHPYSIQRSDLAIGRANRLSILATELKVPLLVGAMTLAPLPKPPDGSVKPTHSVRPDRYNSALLFDPAQRAAQIYDKHRLFPVSEVLPFAGRWTWLESQVPGRRSVPGTQRNLLSTATLRIGALVCYDELDGGFARGLAALRPNLLVAISSAAQIGGQAAPRQQLAMARLRSIELRLDQVRATQNGISAIIDASGRMLAETRAVDPEQEPGSEAFGLTAQVALLEAPPTFYAERGECFATLNLLAALGLAFGIWAAQQVRLQR